MACTSGLSAWLSCTLASSTAQPERQAVGVGEDVDLRSVLAVIDRVRPGQGPPFLARRLASSTIAADQSISPAAPWASRIARCSLDPYPSLGPGPESAVCGLR